MKSFLKYWLPLVVWVGVILSAPPIYCRRSIRRDLSFRFWWLNFTFRGQRLIRSTVIRKLGHISECAILALVWRAQRPTVRTKTPILFGVVFCVCSFAVTENFTSHSSVATLRSHVLLDSAGACWEHIGAAFSQRAKTVKPMLSELVDARS
jgi:hypothetical protein